MKKGLIMVLLVLLLTGCKSKNDFFTPLENEIEVCIEECFTLEDDVLATDLDHNGFVENLLENLFPSVENELPALEVGTSYTVSDLKWEDANTTASNSILSSPLRNFEYMVEEMANVTEHCLLNMPCVYLGFSRTLSLGAITYGYNDTSAFYELEMIDYTGTVIRVQSLRYNLDGEYGSYEYLKYYPDTGLYEYQLFQNGIHQTYNYSGETSYSYDYINIKTTEHLFFTKSNTESVYYFDSSEEILYTADDGFYTVMKFDEEIKVTALSKLTYGYMFNINFHYVEGWDSLQKQDTARNLFDKLYLGSTEVFTEFEINTTSLTTEYMNVWGSMQLTKDELDDVSFPTGFNGDITMRQLKRELSKFQKESHPLKIAGIETADILERCVELQNQFKQKYPN